MQAQLDARIEREHPRQEGEDRLAKKILALQVELGELANELPEVFKFWSNKKNNYKKALEEYVDCLHFILSIGLELKVENNFTPYTYTTDNITRQFNVIFQDLAKLDIIINDEISSKDNTRIQYFELFADVLGICEMLGFSWKEVERAYIEKNKVNHERQVTGY